jgi:photosystem II stability/assembly factor-like uncharacterized protein
MYSKIKSTIYGLICFAVLVSGVDAQRKPTKSNEPQTKPVPQQAQRPPVKIKSPYRWSPIFLGSDIEFIADNTDNYLYAKNSHTLYRSSDFGKTWSGVFEPPPESNIKNPAYTNCESPSFLFKQSKSDPRIIYIAIQGDTCKLPFMGSWTRKSEIWRSIDGGNVWSNMTNGNLDGRILSFSISPQKPEIIYLTLLQTTFGVGNPTENYGLLKSPNGGKTWAVVTPNGASAYSNLNVSINPFDGNNIILIDGTYSPKETNDGGITWHEMEYDLKLPNESEKDRTSKERYWDSMWFHPIDANIRVGRIFKGNINRHLVVSQDNGKSWKDITPESGGYLWNGYRVEEEYRYQWINSIAFSQNEKEKLYAGNRSGLFVSANLGQTWKRVLNEGAYSIIESKDGKSLNILTHFGTFQSDTDFKKWTVIGNGLPAGNSLVADRENMIYPADSFNNYLYLIKPNGDLIRTTNMNDWIFEKNFLEDINTKIVRVYGPLRIVQIFKTSDSVTFLTVKRNKSLVNSIFKITDAGTKFEIPLPKEVVSLNENWCYCGLALSPNDSNKLYLYSEKKLFISNDSGNTWTESLNNGVDFVAVSPKDPNQAYAILKASPNSLNSVVSTTDGGKSWYAGSTALSDIAINIQITTPFETVTVDSNNPNLVYVTSRNGLFYSRDQGQNWSLLANSTKFGGEIYSIEVNQASGNELFLTSKSGIWKSNDSGRTWSYFNNGIIDGELIYKIISSKDFIVAIGRNKIYQLSFQGVRANTVASNTGAGAGDSEPDLLVKSREMYLAGRNDEALLELSHVLTIKPMNAEAYLLIGRIYVRRNDHESAISALKTAIFWDAKLIAAHILLGRIFLERGERAQAIIYARSAMQINPNEQEAIHLQRQIKAGGK